MLELVARRRSTQYVLEDEGAEVGLLDAGAAPQAVVDEERLELRDRPLRQLRRVRQRHLCTSPHPAQLHLAKGEGEGGRQRHLAVVVACWTFYGPSAMCLVAGRAAVRGRLHMPPELEAGDIHESLDRMMHNT